MDTQVTLRTNSLIIQCNQMHGEKFWVWICSKFLHKTEFSLTFANWLYDFIFSGVAMQLKIVLIVHIKICFYICPSGVGDWLGISMCIILHFIGKFILLLRSPRLFLWRSFNKWMWVSTILFLIKHVIFTYLIFLHLWGLTRKCIIHLIGNINMFSSVYMILYEQFSTVYGIE